MAKRKKAKNATPEVDDRIRKIVGSLILSISIFLFVAFISYLFTWRADQAAALSYGWSLMFKSDVTIANWLGPVGAYVSHLCFFYGFGLTSFLFVYLFAMTGLAILKRRPLFQLQRQIKWGLIGLMGLSIFLSFAFQFLEFPIGGAYGYLISSWLEGLFGVVGVVLLMIIGLVSLVIWIFNPSWSDIISGNFFKEINLKPSFAGQGEVFNKNTSSRPKKRSTAVVEENLSHSQNISVDSPEEPLIDIETEVEVSDQPKPILIEGLDFPSEDEVQPEGVQTSILDELEMEVTYANNDQSSSIADDSTNTESLFGEERSADGLRAVFDAEKQDAEMTEGPYDPKKELENYQYPTLELLKEYPNAQSSVTGVELAENKRQIVAALESFSIQIKKISATVGPTITLYEIVPASGVRVSSIKRLGDDIALKLGAPGVRIVGPIPGRGSIGIEVPNRKRQIVPIRDVLQSTNYREAKMELPVALGKTISNETMVVDLAKMPHLLVAGATGQGKSVGINTIITSLLYRKHPAELKFVMIDPKKVELSLYSLLERHFLTYMPEQEEAVITENEKALNILNSVCVEMDQRYDLLKQAKVRNIKEYNAKFKERRLNPEKGHKFFPYIVVIVDEFADLIVTAGKDIEKPIMRIAQLARAVGIHLIIATQRPSVKIITGAIKANFPARLAFKVSSNTDSKVIIDSPGAEQLIGMGDMLLVNNSKKERLQCAFIDTPEVEHVLEFISNQDALYKPYLLPEYVGEGEESSSSGRGGVLTPHEADDLLRDAAIMIVENGIGSTSFLQRKLSLGYNRAGRIMDQLCELGIVGDPRGSKPREVHVHSIAELENMLNLFYGTD